jgi:4-diphosphocytidyl-2C-methyl-D-erythritol kinase
MGLIENLESQQSAGNDARRRQTIPMSGSGSTLFTLTDHRRDAERIAAHIHDASIRAGVFELTPAP